MHKPLVDNSQHKCHLIEAQNVHATVELAAHRSGVFQCNFSVERVRQEATERSESGRIRELDIWAVCGGLKSRSTELS